MSAATVAVAPSDLFSISHHDKMMAATRELDLRRSVYPRRVADGKMTDKAASRQIALMQAIVDDYALIAAVSAPVVHCRPVTCKVDSAGPVLIVDTLIQRPGEPVPRRVDLAMPLDAYSATEFARRLLPWLAVTDAIAAGVSAEIIYSELGILGGHCAGNNFDADVAATSITCLVEAAMLAYNNIRALKLAACADCAGHA